MNIPESEYRRRRLRAVALSVFGVLLAVGNMLWGCYQLSERIQPSDYLAAVLLAVFVAACSYAGWCIAVRRMRIVESGRVHKANASESARTGGSEA